MLMAVACIVGDITTYIIIHGFKRVVERSLQWAQDRIRKYRTHMYLPTDRLLYVPTCM